MKWLGLAFSLMLGIAEAQEIAVPTPALAPNVPEPSAPASPSGNEKDTAETYPELTLKNGTVYRKCRVVRSEPDALLVEHEGGMARLSLFELPEEVQKKHGFDPFAAMEHYKKETEKQRELKWHLFWERQQYESEQARLADQDALRRRAEREWVPVEATVIQRLDDGAVLARVQRITFEKTKTKSTLGFVIDGPPKRKLVAFAKEPIVLRPAVPVEGAPAPNSLWKGFVNPVSEGNSGYSYRGQTLNAVSHLAVPLR